MGSRRIKADWASLSRTSDGRVIVCTQYSEAQQCVCFDSLQLLKQKIDNKRVSIKKWAVGVPRSLCIVKQLALPASDLAEAAKMIEFEIPSLIPLPPADIAYGCTLLNKRGNMLNVLVCILKLNTLDEYLEPFRYVGIEPHQVTLEPLAVQNWFNIGNGDTTGSVITGFVGESRWVVLTSIDGHLQRVSERVLHNTDAAVAASGIVQEISSRRNELPISDAEPGKTRLLLTGPEEYVSRAKRLLAAVQPDSAAGGDLTIVELPRITHYEAPDREDHSDSFSYEAVAAAGLFDLAKYSKLVFSNLVPQSRLRKFQRKAALFNYVFAGAVSLTFVVLLWLCLWAFNRRVALKSLKIESEIAPIHNVAAAVDKKRQRVRAIRNQLANRGLIAKLFEELYKYTPKNISISELTFSQKQNRVSIEIKGQADILSNALEYAEAMGEASWLNHIQIVNAQQIPRPGGSVVEFKARCLIRSD
ncbi:MAG: PilN domain-containing protein [Planctomycetota bacterium]|jgi:hypothetical protein